MKVAFATTTGTTIDEHFGRAGAVRRLRHHPRGRRASSSCAGSPTAISTPRSSSPAAWATLHDDAIATKIDKLADAKIVYFTEIGGPSAAKLVRRGIMPLKAEPGTSITAEADARRHHARQARPWMRRALRRECDGPADTADWRLLLRVAGKGCCCQEPPDSRQLSRVTRQTIRTHRPRGEDET